MMYLEMRQVLVHSKRNTILCMPISYERRTKESHSKRDGLIRTFRYYSKRVDQLQFTSCPSQMKESKFVQSL